MGWPQVKRYLNPALKFATAAAAVGGVLMTSITIRRVWSGEDGPDINAYGAPLAWHHFSEVSSMESAVSLVNLGLDWLFHLVVAAGLLWFVRKWVMATEHLWALVGPCLLVVVLQLAPVFLNVHYGLREHYSTVEAALQLGIAGPAYPEMN